MENNIIDIIFSPVILPLTILAGILAIFWVVSSLLGMDADLDFDVDVDADVDMDIDTGVEAGTVGVEDFSNVELEKEHVVHKRKQNLKPWQVFLIYFNFVGVPFLFTTTVFVVFWWLCSMLATILTNSHHSGIGYLFVLAAFIPALFLGKMFTQPFKPIFRQLNKDGDAPIDYIGRKGTSLSKISEDKLGNGEVIVEGMPMNIYIKSYNGEAIDYRDSILIIRESADKTFYFVQKYKD